MKKLRTRKHEVVLNRSVGGDVGITIILTIFGLFMFLPMYYTIIQSLKPMDEIFYFPPRFYVVHPTMENFKSLFNLMSDSWVPFSRYIFNTVLISVGGTFGNLVLSSLSAYALAKIDFPGNKFFFALIQKSLMFSATVTGLVNFITLSWLGWIDTYLAIIIPAFASTLGLYLMKQFMETNVTTEVLESARLDGASELRTFWSIAMPMVKPAWLTLIIYSFQGLWNAGQTNLIYSEQLKTLNYAISQITAGGVARTGASAASTVVMMAVPILVFVVSQSNIIETMGSSGMKD
ncbi:MAG: carbohydrate ABC transporter permease [Eubacteriales bacterium]|nr:carbohydrate ABC transporter permease [Clostridiales bacterium]MDD7774534.1 carbohydrate ABC transporter permease [Eubacteriales bacterium]MDY3942079.1 carbohydrate ABC transporter permease [Eubacteriales bacterium]